MARIKFELDLAGLNELMKGGEMCSLLDTAANQIAAAAGDGYEVESAHGIRFIGIASVQADSWSARWHNSKENTLLRAMGSVHL